MKYTPYFFTILLFFFLLPLHGQHYLEMILNADDHTRFEDIRTEAEKYFATHDRGKGSGYKQYKRWEEFNRFRLDDDGTLTNYTARLFEENLRTGRISLGSTALPGQQPPATGGTCAGDLWTQLGPSVYVNGNYGYNPGLGRVNVIAFDPVDTNVIYLGAPAGSLWKTTDGGSTWTPLTDQLGSIGVSGIAVDHDDPNHIFILTGDGDGGDTYSIGVMESMDGGLTWNTTGLSYSQSQVKRGYKLLMHPENSDTMFLAMRDGIFRTYDGWQSWTNVRSGSFRDIEFNPANPQILYATTTTQFYRSADGGNTWAIIPDKLVSNTNRIEIGVSPDEPSFVYLVSGPSTGNGQFTGISRSVDNGLTFTPTIFTPNILGYSPSGSDGSSQTWYDLAIAVSPADAASVITGGVNVWKSTDSCNSTTVRSYWVDPSGYEYTHADIHELVFNPLDHKLYCGSDGGIFVSSDYGDTWTDISEGLVITQFYRIASSEKRPDIIIGGTQDNGSNKWFGNDTIIHIYGADGMDCMVDHTYPDTIYFSSQGGGLRKSYNGGYTSFSIRPTNGPWVTPYAMHPDSSNVIFGGWNDLHRSDDGGANWLNTGMPCNRAIAIAESNPRIIYTASGSSVYRSTDGGLTYVNVSQGLPGRTIASMTVNPKDPDEVWTCYGGFSGSQKVYRTLNGGGTWVNMSSGVPNVPVNSIRMVDHFKNGGLTGAIYIGTDIGVYYRDDFTNWTCASNELPNVPVFDIEFNYDINKIRIGTFGRGIWESTMITSVEAICKNAVKYLDSSGIVRVAVSDVDSASHSPLGIDTIYVNPDTFYCQDTGTHLVTLTVIDMAGHSDQCVAEVQILDTMRPDARCKSMTVYLDSSGQAALLPSEVDDGSSDNCGIAEMTLNPSQYSCTDDSVMAVFVVIDASGNRDSCELLILVRDTIHPWIACVDTLILYLDENGEAEIGQTDLIDKPSGSDTFLFTGQVAQWIPPAGVDSFQVELYGASGGPGVQGALGGKGGMLSAHFAINATDTLFVKVGGAGSTCSSCLQGGYNGGGGTEVLSPSFSAGTGGGASDIRINDTLLTSRIAVAAGGGGGGFITSEASGGDGGGWTGMSGGSWSGYPPGGGASQIAGGNGGSGAAYNQSNAGNGTLGYGGRGRGLTGGGGGGGAGYYGGGGGFVAGGGGGSSFASSMASQVHTATGVHEGDGMVIIHWKSNGSYGDNCAIASIQNSRSEFNMADLGQNIVNVILRDENENENTCSAVVLVLDTIAPQLSCRNYTLYLNDSGQANAVADSFIDQLWDAAGLDSVWTQPVFFDCENIGETEITVFARDSNGNTSSCEAIAVILDTIRPMALIHSDTAYLNAEGFLHAEAEWFFSSVFDACGVDSIWMSPLEFNCNDTGWQEVVIVFRDKNGNESEYQSSLYILDTTAPIARCHSAVLYLNVDGMAFPEPALIDDGSEDACGIAGRTLSRDTLTCSDTMVTVTLLVTDVNGNSSQCTAEIEVFDTIKPVIECKDVTVFLDENGLGEIDENEVLEVKEDNCGIDGIVLSKSRFECSDTGSQEISVVVRDYSGNVNECLLRVEVEDTLPPIIHCRDTVLYLNADGILEVEVELLAEADDNCGVLSLEASKNRFDCEDIGENEIIVEALDGNGQAVQCASLLTVRDTTPPIAHCRDTILYLDENGVAELDPEMVNNQSEDACGISELQLSRDRFECEDLGENTVLLTVYDESENSAQCESTIEVKDTVSPVVRCRDTSVYLDENGHAALPASWIDDDSEDACGIDSIWVVPNEFGTADLGENAVTLWARDSSGNLSSCEATVIVYPYSTGMPFIAGHEKIRLYPNPLMDKVTLEIENTEKKEINWEIFDLLGRKRMSGSEGKSEYLIRELNMQNYASGSYLIHIHIGQSIHIRKIVKMR